MKAISLVIRGAFLTSRQRVSRFQDGGFNVWRDAVAFGEVWGTSGEVWRASWEPLGCS